MKSVCLNHQDRVTDIRCVACLKPICEDCVLVGPDGGKYCSQTCVEHAKATEERFAEFKRLEEEASARARRKAGTKAVLALGFLVVLAILAVYAWPRLPDSMTGPMEQLFHKYIR